MEKQCEHHRASLLTNISELRRTDKYTDVQVASTYGGRTFPCHKVVLAASSPVIDAMLQVEMAEQLSNRIKLPYDEDTIDAVLRFIYTGYRIITKDNLFPVYQAANYLDIGTLIEYGEKCLKSHLSVENCVGCWKMGIHMDSISVTEMAKSVVIANFSQLCNEDTLLELGLSDLATLLKDCLLNCVPATKCRALILWHVLHDDGRVETKESVSNLAKELLISGVINATDLNMILQDDSHVNWISEYPARAEKIADMRGLYRKLLDSIVPNTSSSCNVLSLASAPATNLTDEHLIVIGGNPEHKNNEVIMLGVRESKWYRLPAVPSDPGYHYSACSEGATLYVSGGSTTPTQFLELDVRKNVWKVGKPLLAGREQHNMCGVNKRVYVLCGSTRGVAKQSDVHMYSTADGMWIKAGEVMCPVTLAVTTIVDSTIYILGGVIAGEGQGVQPCDLLQCFDTNTHFSWTVRKSLPFKAKRNTIAVGSLHNTVIIVHRGSVYDYELSSKDTSVKKVCTMDMDAIPVRNFGVAVIGGRVLIFGGEDSSFNVSSRVVQYCQGDKIAVCLPLSSPWPLKDFVFTTLRIPMDVHLQAL